MRSREKEHHQCGRGGFTLIEVLLVVTILGILAAIVVAKYAGRGEDARIAATRASIAVIAGAIDVYEVDTGRYPPSLQSLVSDDGAPNWHGEYIRNGLPVDAWGTAFQYALVGKSFKITSAGPDKNFGSADDITN